MHVAISFTGFKHLEFFALCLHVYIILGLIYSIAFFPKG